MNETTKRVMRVLAAHAELQHMIAEWRNARQAGRTIRPAEIAAAVEGLSERQQVSMWIEDGVIVSATDGTDHRTDISDLYGGDGAVEDDAELLDERLEELDDDDLEERWA